MKFNIKLAVFILFLISLAVLVPIYSKWLYLLDLKHYDLAAQTGLSDQVIAKNYDVLMNYLLNPFQHSLALPDFKSSTSGLKHFLDVKLLFHLTQAIFLISLPIAVSFWRELARTKQFWRLINPMRILLFTPLALVFLILVGFDSFFISFHQLIFRDNSWLFYPSLDPIILALPEEYFKHCFILGLVILEGSAFLGYLKGRRALSVLLNRRF
ncbi:MAG: TIGR01906 family membrane protein [Streptococcaceae bacterium]|jgi:integral membrane protein (TIGR01906 family)|nr:TIGR01906 family membrane protein [Streptococcaceae bacterium]